MGFFLALFVLALSAGLVYLFGFSLWLVFVLLILFSGGFFCTLRYGHRGFKGGANTDMLAYIVIVALALAVVYPQYSASLKNVGDKPERPNGLQK